MIDYCAIVVVIIVVFGEMMLSQGKRAQMQPGRVGGQKVPRTDGGVCGSKRTWRAVRVATLRRKCLFSATIVTWLDLTYTWCTYGPHEMAQINIYE